MVISQKYCTVYELWYTILLGFSEVSFSPISMNIASKHLQYSVVAGLIAVCGLTIGFAGAEDSTLPSFALSFIQDTPNIVQDGPFAGAKFEIGGSMSHPCYEIAGMEAKICEDQFGLTQSLKTYIDNGSLLAYLQSKGLTVGSKAVMSSSSTSSSSSSVSSAMSSSSAMSEVSSSSEMSNSSEPIVTHVLNDTIKTEADFEQLRQNRSDELWSMCGKEFRTRYAVAACFQRNMNLLLRYDTMIEGNVK